LELAPFNVKVTNVVTGSIKTEILDKKPHSFPLGSKYKSAEETSYQMMTKTMEGGTDVGAYAKSVASEILKNNPRANFWAGKNSWTIWFIDTFLGSSGFDYIMPSMFGLTEVKKTFVAEKATQKSS